MLLVLLSSALLGWHLLHLAVNLGSTTGSAVGLFLSSMANKNSTLRCTFSSPSHSATLLQGLSVLRAHGQLLDVVLAINEERFQVHRAVLAACSDYFRLERHFLLPFYTLC